jgi:hypothetical protein
MGGACSRKDTKLLSENLKGRQYLEDLYKDERIILKWILKKYGGKMWNGFIHGSG